MNDWLVWIKMIVRLCLCEFETEVEKRLNFKKMEEVYEQFTEAERKKARNVIKDQFEVNDRVYIFSVLMQYMEHEDFQKGFMESILEGNYDGDTGSMLEWIALIHVKGEYTRKRKLYKKNMESFQNMLDINLPYLPIEQRNKKRIVIVAGQVLNILHAPTRIMMDIAYVLQECLNYEVLLFACPSDKELPRDLCLQKYKENTLSEFDNAPMIIIYQNTEFRGYQISMTPWSKKEYSMMLWMIHAWNPMFVLDMSTINAVVGLAGKFTTLVSFPLSTACPISEGEILVRNGRKDDSVEKEYTDMLGEHQVQLKMTENSPITVKMSQNNYTLEQLGLPKGQFLVAVVGNRLDMEIDREFVEVMKKILEKDGNISFVMIGGFNEIKEYFTDEIFNGHIYDLGYCKDLTAVYKTLNLFLNPKRAGGGFSSGMALLAGIPVVTLPECDVAYNCGEEWVVQDYGEMVKVVAQYAADKEFYNEKVEHARKYGEEDSRNKLLRYVTELLEGIEGILESRNR